MKTVSQLFLSINRPWDIYNICVIESTLRLSLQLASVFNSDSFVVIVSLHFYELVSLLFLVTVWISPFTCIPTYVECN